MQKSNDKILIFGRGQIGNFYKKYFENETNHEVIISSVDITNIEDINTEFKKIKPTVVINAAGKTNLEWTKDNRLKAFEINSLGADNLARACDENNVYYIFLSSGCIFASIDENDAKTEEATPKPEAYYSFTKVWAEQLIKFKKSENFKYLILRPRQPVSSEVNHKNMLVKLLTFTKFVNTPNTGTIIEDLMIWTKELMEKRYVGIVNAANDGYSTPYEIALLLKKHVLPELDVTSMTKEELDANTPSIRVDTVLNMDKLKSLVSSVEPYEKRLEDTIIKLGENFKTAGKDVVEEHMTNTFEATKQRATPNKFWQLLIERA